MRLFAIVCFAASLGVVGAVSAAPVSYTGGTYTQNFNGLTPGDEFFPKSKVITGRGPHDLNTSGNPEMPTTGMEGWTISNPTDLPSSGANAANTEYRSHAGELSGGNGRGVLSLGLYDSTERALGSLSTGAQVNRFGVALKNDSTTTWKSFSLEFTGEQWRRGDVTAPAVNQNQLKYAFAITSNPLDDINTSAIFTDLGAISSPITTGTNIALNGNLPANQVPKAHVVSNINWAPGDTLLLRWQGWDANGQDDALAIDNLSLTASTAIPEPATAAIVLIAACGGALVRRRRC